MKKKVIRQFEVAICSESDVHVEYYYGITNGNTVTKGFITRCSYQEGDFRLICAGEEITDGNSWTVKTPTLSQLIRYLLDNEWTVYQFDTYQELFKWLAE